MVFVSSDGGPKQYNLMALTIDFENDKKERGMNRIESLIFFIENSIEAQIDDDLNVNNLCSVNHSVVLKGPSSFVLSQFFIIC